MDQKNEQQGIFEKLDEICKIEEEISSKKRKIIEETEDMATKMLKMMDEIKKGMVEKDKEIGKLKKENRALKLEMTKMKADLKAQNILIRRKMPVELMNELFGSLLLENAIGLLAKMPNGLLARNVQKMINGIKEAMKNNKLNEDDCGPKLEISDDGLTVKHSGPNVWNCVRAVLPIPKLNGIKKRLISSYFEVQILEKLTSNYCNQIGFCDLQFPLEGKSLGWYKNSIGIRNKGVIWIGDTHRRFENGYGLFEKGDVIGLGIIQRPNSERNFFATLNGKLLGEVELPSKFANIQFYPTLSMFYIGDSIRVNFGKEKWQFKEFNRIL